MRLTKIEGADLRLFEFDYDLTWMVFFLNADERIYGRYGGRDAASADSRISLPGLRYAMQAALDAHRAQAGGIKVDRSGPPVRAENFPGALQRRGRECIHCHQVNEYTRAARKDSGEWSRNELWAYPLPENVGITLEVDRGNHVRAVAANSAAEQVGIKAGDVVRSANSLPVASFADLQYALHRGPVQGKLPIVWERDGKTLRAELVLAQGWRKTNLTWRPSLLDILPSLPLYGDDLTPQEKKKLGLPEKRLAFRQDKSVHSSMKAAGVQADDVVIGLNEEPLEMTVDEFLGYVRRNFLVGDKATLNVIRSGKPIDLPMTLR